MARPFPEPETKWVIKTAINLDPATLAKNLTILCTVAFSATVFYVMYSNSKRPRFTQYTQVSDEDLPDEDHTTQCKSRCRHSIVGKSDRTRPPDMLMNFGSPLDGVQSPSSRRAYCPLEPTIVVNMAKDEFGDGSLTSSDVGLQSCGIDNAETQTTPLIMASSVDSSSDFCSVDNAETQTMPSIMVPVLDSSSDVCKIGDAETQTMPSIMAPVLGSSSDVTMAAETLVDGALSSVASLFTQVQPSISTSTASAAKVFESSPTETLPLTTSTTSGPDVTAAGRLDSTCLCSGFTRDPNCTRAKAGFLRNLKEDESRERSREDVSQCDSTEKDDDSGSHFEGYIYGIIREKGSKSYKRRLYGGVSFGKEKLEQGAGGCFREKRDLGEKEGVGFHEACTHLESGIEVCKDISIGRPNGVMEGGRKKTFDIISSQEGCANTLSRDCKPRNRNSCTQTEVKDKCTSISREACRERPLKQLPILVKDEIRHLLNNIFECRDKGTEKFVDTFSASSTRGACIGTPLKQLPTLAKDETRHLLSNNFDCRDKDTGEFDDLFSVSNTMAACMERPLNQLPTLTKDETRHLLGNNCERRDKSSITSVGTFKSGTRGAWTGRPFKQTRTMPGEEICKKLVFDSDFGIVERCAEERREGGITSEECELEQTKSSLKTLTETEHWSKMSLPEQYECLGLLDSTLAAASGEY